MIFPLGYMVNGQFLTARSAVLISVDCTILAYWVQHSETIDGVAEISAVSPSETIF